MAGLRRQESQMGRLLLSPTVLIVLAVVVLPIVWAISLATPAGRGSHRRRREGLGRAG
jgi:ABC-type sugar transport system permease subunit